MLRRRLLIPLLALFLSACLGRAPHVAPPTPLISAQATPSATLAPSSTVTPHVIALNLSPTDSPTSAAPTQTQTLTPTLTPTSLDPTTLGRVENFVALGHESLGARGWNAGLALSYPCAYIGNRRLSQVAIVDIHDPARPTLVNELHLAPGDQPVELRAVPDLNLLVILNFLPGRTVLTYDVSDCRHPQPLGALDLGAVPHEFFLWRDPAQPARLLLYAAMFYHIQPDLHVVELTDPTHPRRIATWTAADESASGTLHSLSLSPDGRRAYLALWEGGLLVADTSELAEGKPDPRIHLLREGAGFTPASGVNVHSAVRLAGPRYVLLTQELYECPFAGLFIADIANEAHPQIVGRFELPENDPACTALPQPDAVFTAHNPLVVHDLIFVTWYGGGLQALDVSDPTQPRRVGLFVPSGEGAARASYVGTYPVQMWSYPILHEGSLYVSDIQSGLYVLRYTGPGAEALSQIAHAEGNLSVLP